MLVRMLNPEGGELAVPTYWRRERMPTMIRTSSHKCVLKIEKPEMDNSKRQYLVVVGLSRYKRESPKGKSPQKTITANNRLGPLPFST